MTKEKLQGTFIMTHGFAKSEHTKRKSRIPIQKKGAVIQMPCFWGVMVSPPPTHGYFITWLEILINTVYAWIFDFIYLSIQQ